MATIDKLKKKPAEAEAVKPAKKQKPVKENTEASVEVAEDEDGFVNVMDMIKAQYEANNPEDKITKKEIQAVLKAYHTILTEATFKNGKVRLGEFGSLITVPVAGRKGVSKMTGEEKAWETKDRWTIKLRLNPGTVVELDELEQETQQFASDEFKK